MALMRSFPQCEARSGEICSGEDRKNHYRGRQGFPLLSISAKLVV